MSKKKAILLVILALVVGIGIGILGTLGVMNSRNTGAIYGTTGDTSGTQYIDMVKLGGGYWNNVAKDAEGAIERQDSKGRNYSRLGKDLNDGCGTTSDYIYMFEARTDNAEDAITDFLIGVGEEYNVKTLYYNGYEYKAVSGYRGDWTASEYTVSRPYDLNKGAGGANVYLFYTKDPKAGQPITKIYFTNQRNEPGDFYVYTETCGIVNLNKDAGGDNIFMKYCW